MAEALPEGGTVLTCEIDPESAAFARRFWDKSPHGRKIEVRVGPALETLRTLTGPFDVIFIDADKANYVSYYRRAQVVLAPTRVVPIDKMLSSRQGPGAGGPCPAPPTHHEVEPVGGA